MLQEQLEQKQLRVARLEQAQVGDEVDRRPPHRVRRSSRCRSGCATSTRMANQRLALLGSQADAPDAGPSVSPADGPGRTRRGRAAARGRRRRRGRVGRIAGEPPRRARSRLDAVDEEIAAQSALVSRHDLEITKLSGQADAAAQRLAAVRGEVLRQQNALDAATERREKARADFAAREAEAATADAGEGNLDEAYELAQADVFEAEGEIERLREELHVLERERDALAARTSALSQALDQKDGSAALVAARLPGVRGLVGRTHPRASGIRGVDRRGPRLAGGCRARRRPRARVRSGRPCIHRRARPGRGHHRRRVAPDVDLSGVDRCRRRAFGRRGAGRRARHPGLHGDRRRPRCRPRRELAAFATRELGGPVTIITKTGEVLTDYVLRGGSGAEAEPHRAHRRPGRRRRIGWARSPRSSTGRSSRSPSSAACCRWRRSSRRRRSPRCVSSTPSSQRRPSSSTG